MQYRLVTYLEAVPIQAIRVDQDADPILTILCKPEEQQVLWSTRLSRNEYMTIKMDQLPSVKQEDISLTEYQQRYDRSGITRVNPVTDCNLPVVRSEEPEYQPWTAEDPDFDPNSLVEQERQDEQTADFATSSWRLLGVACMLAGLLILALLLGMYFTFGSLP